MVGTTTRHRDDQTLAWWSLALLVFSVPAMLAVHFGRRALPPATGGAGHPWWWRSS